MARKNKATTKEESEARIQDMIEAHHNKFRSLSLDVGETNIRTQNDKKNGFTSVSLSQHEGSEWTKRDIITDKTTTHDQKNCHAISRKTTLVDGKGVHHFTDMTTFHRKEE